MVAISRRSQRAAISREFELAAADDLDGTSDNTEAVVATGAARAIITQLNDGTAGTAGIDVIQVSYDGGSNWQADDTLLAIDANDYSGTIVASAALNAAGVEPTLAAMFKAGPWKGPVLIRCSRKTNEGGTTWVTGAPTVKCVLIGQTTGAPAAKA